MEKRHLTDFIWRSRSCRAALFLLAALGFASGQTAWGTEKGFETPPTLKAGEVLAAELLKGNRYRIEETVPTDGFLMKFTIVSDFGTFIARSPGMAETRVKEIETLERLKKTTGRPWIMPVATTVLSFDQARFVVEAMEMPAGYDEKISPIIALENKAPFAGRTASGTLVVAGPVDLLAWTERINLFAVRPDLKAKKKILWLRGEATPEARQQLTKLGWTVRDHSDKE